MESKLYRKCQEILEEMSYSMTGADVSEQGLEFVIGKCAGGDRETLKKYKKYLYLFGFLERTAQGRHKPKKLPVSGKGK